MSLGQLRLEIKLITLYRRAYSNILLPIFRCILKYVHQNEIYVKSLNDFNQIQSMVHIKRFSSNTVIV